MTARSDTFDRADSTSLGSDWAEDSGNWAIVSNNVSNGTTGNVYRKLRWVGAALDSNDYSVAGTYRSGSSSLGIGPAARCVASATVSYYALIIFGGDAAYLVYINAGAETVLDSGSAITASTNYELRIEVEGTTIRGYVNGVLDLEATHSALSSGSPGIAGYGGNNANTYCATWAAEDLGGGASQINVSDTAAGSDALLTAILVAVADAAAAVDGVGSIAVQVPVSDVAQAAHVIGAIAATLAVVDLGAGVDVAIAFDAAVRIVRVDFSIARRSVAFAWLARSLAFGWAEREIQFSMVAQPIVFGFARRDVSFTWNR